MRHLDLTPLYKSTLGFDRLASLFDSMNAPDRDTPSYPPYNIERLGDSEYRLTMAVAGFAEEDLDVEVKDNALTIRGERKNGSGEAEVLHRGIATRTFERRFQLADHVEVRAAKLENGLLHVDLVRELPEAMKPRTITIESGNGSSTVIENKS